MKKLHSTSLIFGSLGFSLSGISILAFTSLPGLVGFFLGILGIGGFIVIALKPGNNEAKPPTVLGDGRELKDRLLNIQTASLEAEDAGMRMAAQVGNTMAFVAQIAGESGTIALQSQTMERQVTQGAAAMEEIQATIESLARQITNQSGVVHESAAAIEQMTASIASVGRTVSQRQTVVDSLSKYTAHGREQVETTQGVIADVSKSVGSVSSMIEVIDDIAARTNLLAMNAAIEAAHAGNAGRGFAVVAGEIRKLAVSTAENAALINKTLKALSTTMDQALSASKRTGDSFGQISEGVRSVSQAFGEIHGSTQELDAGAQDMLHSTSSLGMITDEIRVGAQEMREASAEITKTLVGAAQLVHQTAEGVRTIASNTNALSSATGKICDLNQQSNSAVRSQLEFFQKMEELPVQAQAIQRLTLSNIILAHLKYLVNARSLLNGNLEAKDLVLVDHTKCELGKWMAGEGKETIGDEVTFERLDSLHRQLHEDIAVLAHDSSQGQERYTSIEKNSKEIVEILSGAQIDDSIKWSPAIAVNVEKFDQHHRNLVQMIDRVYQSMKGDQTNEKIKEIFDDLLDYTGYHFNAEESAFEYFGYEHCDDHKEMHRKLVAQATALRRELDEGKPMIAIEVKEFLRDWIVNHIQKCDRLYSNFFQGKDLTEFFDRRAERIEEGIIRSRA
ncbi:MAG: bacteriohemerythrin [Spirochaetales bacterium]|nr:bacteriohemerythrin [Spirochaetales bacterium]